MPEKCDVLPEKCDVLVIGGGNAALAAAINASANGKKVVLLESSSKSLRGGNSRHTRNLRIAHNQPLTPLTNSYSSDNFFSDILDVTGGETNKKLAKMVAEKSTDAFLWLKHNGVLFQKALSGTLNLAHSNAFFLGGGKSLINSLYRSAETNGVAIFYETKAHKLDIVGGHFNCAEVSHKGETKTIAADNLVVASGGFQANMQMLQEIWGDKAKNFLIRGTSENTGVLLKSLIAADAKPVASLDQCHAVACDARANTYDDGIISRFDGVCFSVVVNNQGQRFYDEGEDIWPKRYAIWGRLVALQPEQIAYAIVDSKVINSFMPSPYAEIKADSIADLEQLLSMPQTSLQATIAKFNTSIVTGKYDTTVLDNCSTQNLEPPKSHWALPIDTAPYYAFPLKAGITFTYYGVTVDENAKVIRNNGAAMANVYASGEIMAGNILGKGYCAGTGMTIGTVFGQKAGAAIAATS